ncbi:response regulator [Alphaproteobacteria bacterium KMM 3653]|uniref:histidine kinase n=1 Tax=Harenicola maris TaxID=2841044 RepID=A0AAP2CNU8_9RHOB|nr:response regulator [Harenicola maris]
MAQLSRTSFRRVAIAMALCGLALAFILFLAINVSKDLRLLNSASSDNVQWTLSQAEVEFLDFQIDLDLSARAQSPDLDGLRRKFDVFYSRVTTLRSASIYAPLREVEDFATNLEEVQLYLDAAVPMIDGDDAALMADLPLLEQQANQIRPSVRRLANSGLNFFANASDKQRENLFSTLSQLAFGVTLLLLALLLFSIYLVYLNRQNIRRRREAIQTSQRMNVVTSTALDGVIVCDVNGAILEFNEAAEQIFGHKSADVLGQNLGAIIVPDKYREAHEAGMARMRASGEKRVVGKGRIKLEAKRADGTLFPVEFAIQSAQTDEGEVFISFLRDISHRVAAENELVAARDRALAGEKAKTDFLATMSHEIRTPLNGLLGNLNLLLDTKLSAKQTRYIDNMDISGKLLMSHISDVLDITKYDAGKLQLRPSVMNLSTLLQNIVDNQSGAASANNSTLAWGWSGAKCDWVNADKDRLQHILMNVIGNAVKFTRDGKIDIEARVHGEVGETADIEISVRDTGLGIAEDQIDSIFDDFKTGDTSYDRDVGGTGLGLGIAKRFVHSFGGTIRVESTLGQGSTFFIRLPLEPAKAPQSAAEVAERRGGSAAKHILLVEDNEINRFVASEMLTAQGHRVTEAHNGKEAVDLAQQQAFDLIFMDISMPVMDGRAATRAIRALNSAAARTPIVALTANAMAEEQDAFLADGMNDILTKPILRENLDEILAKYAGSAASGAAAPATPAKTQALIDPQHMAEITETLGAASVHTLLERFASEVEKTLQELTPYQPLDVLAAQAHRVAGTAATLGAVGLRAALIRVETAAKTKDAEALQKGIDALPGIWAETKPLLLPD